MDQTNYDRFWRKRCQSEFKNLYHMRGISQTKFERHSSTVKGWHLKNTVGIEEDSLNYMRSGTEFRLTHHEKSAVKWVDPEEKTLYLNGKLRKTNMFKEYHLGIKSPMSLGFREL